MALVRSKHAARTAARAPSVAGEVARPDMERIARAFLFHEDLATQDEGATLDEALEHVLWCAKAKDVVFKHGCVHAAIPEAPYCCMHM